MVRSSCAVEAQGHAVAPPVPGGLARHYRVQRLDASAAIWRLVRIFPRRELAEACLAEWASRGQAVRLVRYGRCPSAS
jgi:hypothetical protein